MGHVRLGRLPATRKWKEIVQFLASDGFSVADLADRVMDACDKSFSAASKDPAFQKALQLLCQIPIASKQNNLSAALSEIGVSVPDNPSRTDIVVGFEKAIEKAQRDGSKNITDLSELAKQAGIAALNTLLTQPAPAPQLGFWEAPKGDTHRQLQASATPEGFGDLAQTFISNFACSNVRYYMDREMPKHLGADGMVKSISDLTLFDQGVAKHCREASFIMRAFARDAASRVLAEAFSLTQEETRDLLDSRFGRHLADELSFIKGGPTTTQAITAHIEMRIADRKWRGYFNSALREIKAA